jgi:RimJ/RimL family protein N-acetyltransferase
MDLAVRWNPVMQVFLETERLVLRRFTTGDVGNLADLDADPDVMRFVNGGIPTSRDEIENEFLPAFLGYYQRYQDYGFWAAIERSTGDFLGWFHLRPRDGAAPGQVELGYRLRKSAWGKGYATEGSRGLIRKGFTESGVQLVTAEALAGNVASRRVMEKAGLTLLRTFHQPWPDAAARQFSSPQARRRRLTSASSDHSHRGKRVRLPRRREFVVDSRHRG